MADNMQLQGFMLLIFMFIITPIMIMSSNHNIFFFLCAFYLIITSLVSIHSVIFNTDQKLNEDTDEAVEEMEDMLDLDLQRFGIGTMVTRNLIVVLFFVYCSFFLHTGLLKLIISGIAAYWVISTLVILKPEAGAPVKRKHYIASIISMLVHTATIVVIVLVVYNKYLGRMF